MTRVDVAILCARIAAATVFIAHGSQKMFGAFGGPGLAGTVQFLGLIGYLVAVGEFFGGIGVLLGFMSRFSAAAQIVIMIGAIVKVHAPNGFFIGGPKPGYEFNLALIGLLLVPLIAGPGRIAVVNLFWEPRRHSGRPAPALLQ